MKKIKDFMAFLKFEYDLMNLNKELEIIPEIKNNYCKKQELVYKDNYNIAFVIPGILAYSGGHTSILRLGTYLSRFGHNIFYITYDNSNRQQMEKNAKKNLTDYEGTFLEKNKLKTFKFDIGIATSWQSCYWVLAYQDNFNYKIYFVQDFEPYFYAMGDIYHLALNTYKLGFHIISLGKWNKSRIEANTSKKVDYIDFPVELNQYEPRFKRINIDKEVRIALYIKFDSKRSPFFLIQQIKYLYKNLLKDGYQVEIYVFGLNKLVRLPFITNLGRLEPKQIKEIYRNCHLGLVASLTNISLVNYEMIISGLPVIDYTEGSAPTFFSEKEMIFINFNIDDLYKKVLYYLTNQDELNEILKNSQNKIMSKSLTWKNSSKQFDELIREYR